MQRKFSFFWLLIISSMLSFPTSIFAIEQSDETHEPTQQPTETPAPTDITPTYTPSPTQYQPSSVRPTAGYPDYIKCGHCIHTVTVERKSQPLSPTPTQHISQAVVQGISPAVIDAGFTEHAPSLTPTQTQKELASPSAKPKLKLVKRQEEKKSLLLQIIQWLQNLFKQ